MDPLKREAGKFSLGERFAVRSVPHAGLREFVGIMIPTMAALANVAQRKFPSLSFELRGFFIPLRNFSCCLLRCWLYS